MAAVVLLLLLFTAFFLTISSSTMEASSSNGVATPHETASASATTKAPPSVRTSGDSSSTKSETPPLLAQFRSDFVEKYGPDSMDWYKKGAHPFGSMDVTAQRFLSAASPEGTKTFVMAFAGYSVTVGRGNYFHESFPFVLETLLKPLLKELLSIDLEIRNAAIGGIPSFPYAFCTPHFLGDDADVISWDYSMNEGNGAAVMESYLRLSQKALNEKQPMMIVLDKNPQRRKLLQDYADLGILHDGIMLSRAGEVIPKKVLEMEDGVNKPLGLHKWDDFGAPQGCPGKSSWHPKKAEHEFLGYLLAMHFVDTLERALEMSHGWEAKDSFLAATDRLLLPKPLMTPPENNPDAVTQLLYGHLEEDGSGNYELHDLSCRTSFLPAQDHEKVLPSVVVNGLAQSEEFKDIMLERPDSLYQSGWVLDVSKIERDTKKKVEKCGGLGYIDMKIALYGIPESGVLRMWLPYEGTKDHGAGDEDTSAHNYFDDLILCEANEKREDAACRLDRDLQITTGGQAVTGQMVNGAGVYLKRQTCLHVEIPEGAQVTALSDLKTSSGEELSSEDRARLSSDANAIGLVVDLTASSAVTRANGACCVSHIVWEQH
jgi:hypothetical protein